MSPSFLQALAISKTYDGKHLSGLLKTDLSITPGKITAIIGASGSGKTTLLQLLYGLLSPDEGEVRFKGERIWGPEEKLIPGHNAMKMVVQGNNDLNLFAKVWDNVAALVPNTNLQVKKEKTEQLLQQLNITRIADKRVTDLSGGERQRVAIARALITEPEVLLLDEPFNQVDASFREGLQNDIRQIVKQTGLTVVMVSHDPAEVLSMADELLVMKDGQILEAGHPVRIYNEPEQLYTARLLTNCNVLSAQQALVCGIKAEKETVMLYPEWAEPTGSWINKSWTVKHVLFKGFYEELLVEKEGVTLRILNGQTGRFAEGYKINVKIRKWIEYQADSGRLAALS